MARAVQRNMSAGAFNICSSVSCIECTKCGSASRAHVKQASELFGEDLTQRSILNDLDDNFLGDRLMSVVKSKKARLFLKDEIAPVLLPALVQMQYAKPKNPVAWLADWLTLHDAAAHRE